MPEFSTEEKQHIYAEEKAKANQNKVANNTGKGCGCLVVLALIFLLPLVSNLVSSCESRGPDPIGAYVAAQEFIKERLVAPATAKFPPYRKEYVSDLGDGRYVVTAYVDSENRFGAKIRTRFIVKLVSFDSEIWQLEDIQLLK